MKTILKSFAFGSAVLGGVLALSACGDDVTKVYRTAEENSGVEIAKSADDFDDCDAASVGKMMFASDENAAYICADSGWTPLSEKASDGKDGTSCTAELLSDTSGYKIMCGEDSVGIVLNGKTGEAGKPCTISTLDSLTYKIICDNDSVEINKISFSNSNESSQSEKTISYDSLIDFRDGKIYKTVKIGTQTWMAENLNFDDNLSYCYKNSEAFCETYGKLYTWSSAMDSSAIYTKNGENCGYGNNCTPSKFIRGICPENWHLPDSTEWATLCLYIESQPYVDSVSIALKSDFGWYNNNNGSNLFGFNALPAGQRFQNGSFEYIRTHTYFWSSTEQGAYGAYFFDLYYGNASSYAVSLSKRNAFSVRCVKD